MILMRGFVIFGVSLTLSYTLPTVAIIKMSNQYEIEIKTLLGGKERADNLTAKIYERGGSVVSKNKQLNHYFTISDVAKFKKHLLPRINESRKEFFEKILDEGNDFCGSRHLRCKCRHHY